MGDASKRKGAPSAGQTRSGLGLTAVVFLAALLVAPAIALLRVNALGEPFGRVIGVLAISVTAFVAQGIDKRRAEAETWRVPENILHLLELLGGWPGAFVAQRLFRHKTAKWSYQVVFWLIVLSHEWLAVDYLLGWKMLGSLKRVLGL